MPDIEKRRALERRKQAKRRSCPERLEALRAKDRERMRRRHADPIERQKIACRGKMNKRVEHRTFPRPQVFTCCDCGQLPAIEYHHETYEQWWAVEALCRECHKRRHHP